MFNSTVNKVLPAVWWGLRVCFYANICLGIGDTMRAMGSRREDASLKENAVVTGRNDISIGKLKGCISAIRNRDIKQVEYY